MSKLTRREFGRLAAGFAMPLAVTARSRPNSRIRGVQIGIQSFSFRDRPLDACLDAIVECGISSCELWQGHMEPRFRGATSDVREQQRNWRLTAPLGQFRNVGEKFRKAGVEIYAYFYNIRPDHTEEEIDRGFLMARALGAKAVVTSTKVSLTARIDHFASRHRMPVGLHNHADLQPDEVTRPEDFQQAIRGRSRFMAMTLDIGHFRAAGYDPVGFLKKHHARIVSLHIKDRRKDQGENVPFGEGDTPIREVLHVLKRERYAIPATIEYEYEGKDPVEEVNRSFAYCKEAIGSA